ncbi:unnamed protein product [Rhizophagus irregularis]|uniref:DNA-directed RNA polymerase II subunit RPB9 n=1 Tax=Rhizophagus irregularis TaxID=588596 RepID=A0A2I1FYF7_9GLOM|nr:hypothetical protein RhiirA4_414971 [Rhizophagus irregularis]CAB4427608.1 unnamed protein product [Rhizophagus irregularis]
MATFKFCKLCSNLLYPREDKEAHKLFYACRNCIHQEETDNKCVYRNELMNASSEAATKIRDIACDPTLPRTEKECPECGYIEAVFFEQQSRRSGRSDTKMVLYYACANAECGFRWTDYSDNKPKQPAPQDEESIPEGYTEDENYMNDIYGTQGLDNTFQDQLYNNNTTILEPEVNDPITNLPKNEYHNPEDW